MPTDDPVLLTRRDGAVLTLTLNRPQALNSFDGALHDALMAALKDAAADASVRCVVLTGAGRGFCAGQDLSDPAVAPGPQPRDIGALIESRYKPLALLLADFPVPLVAAVNGVAAGAGANLALNCDLVLAARSASFIQAFAKIGLVPDCGGTFHLPRLVGDARARALAMLALPVMAEQAASWGMIWQAIDDDALMPEAHAMAAHLATQPTHALVLTRKALRANGDLDAQLDLERDTQAEASRTPDHREGVRAFLEKRPPAFTGASS